MSDSTRDSLLDILLDVQSGRATVYEGADRAEAMRKSDSTPGEAEGARAWAHSLPSTVCAWKPGDETHDWACDVVTAAAETREAALRARIAELEGALRRAREDDRIWRRIHLGT